LDLFWSVFGQWLDGHSLQHTPAIFSMGKTEQLKFEAGVAVSATLDYFDPTGTRIRGRIAVLGARGCGRLRIVGFGAAVVVGAGLFPIVGRAFC
jgi:hypothetical protein